MFRNGSLRGCWFRFIVVAVVGLAIVSLAGCSNLFGGDSGGSSDSSGQTDDGAGVDDGGGTDDTVNIASDQLEVTEGAVGVVVDARQMFRKGYRPAVADIQFSGDFSSFSAEVEGDPDTSVATLSLDVEEEGLSEAELETLADGVEVSVEVRDADGEVLGSYSGVVPVDSSNLPLPLTTDLPRQYPDVNILEDTPYFIQVIDPDSDTLNSRMFKLHPEGVGSADPDEDAGEDPIILDESFDLSDPDLNEDLYEFYFEFNGFGYYHIKVKADELGDDPVYLRAYKPSEDPLDAGPLYLYSEGRTTDPEDDNDPADFPRYYQFYLEQDENGLIEITPHTGDTDAPSAFAPFAAEEAGDSGIYRVAEGESESDYIPVRAVAANIAWEVTDRGTEYSTPILPPAKLDFAYRSELFNCSSGILTETVGNNTSETRSTTTGTEESFELFSSATETLSVTTGLEVGGAFKAFSASASVEVTNEFSYTTSSTQSTTNTWEETVEETNEVSRERTVELQPFSAVEVYDAVATFENIRMPFVQTLRVQGSYNGTVALSGEEINAQLLANQFGGVVSTIGSDYVDITIRGTAEVTNFYDVQSGVSEIAGACE